MSVGLNYIYALAGRKDAEVSPDVVTGTLGIFQDNVCALIDLGSSLSYVTPFVTKKFGIELELLHEIFAVLTPAGDSMIARWD